jgi:hypothetical protein
MSFDQSMREGFVKKVRIDAIRAKSLILSSQQAISTARHIPVSKDSLKSIFRELYEGLRQELEAIGYMNGYKFLSHESITYFISDKLGDMALSAKFDRYRKLRNGINYYGDDIEEVTVREALEEIPAMIEKLKEVR